MSNCTFKAAFMLLLALTLASCSIESGGSGESGGSSDVALEDVCSNPEQYGGQPVGFIAEAEWLSECASESCDASDAGGGDAGGDASSCCNECVQQATIYCPGENAGRILIRARNGELEACRRSTCDPLCDGIYYSETPRSMYVYGVFNIGPFEGATLENPAPQFSFAIDAQTFEPPLL